MKKNYFVVSAIIILIIFSFLLFSCNKSLDTPDNLVLNEEEILTWNKVNGASSYEVIINDKSLFTDDNKIDLFDEITEPIEYEIKVKALNDDVRRDSSYSNTIRYSVPIFTDVKAGFNGDGTIILTKLNSKDIKGKICIPKEINGKRITVLGDRCFENCNELTGVICDGIEAINFACFKDCPKLRLVNASSAKIVGIGAFYNCVNLETLILTDSLERINSRSLWCTRIKKLYLSKNVSILDPPMFYGCNNLENVEIALDNKNFYMDDNCIFSKKDNKLIRGFVNSIIPSTTKVLGAYAFYGLNIENIDIPEGVEVIEERCFEDCKYLNNIKLPSSVMEVSSSAITGCKNIKKIEIGNNDIYEVINNCLINKNEGSIVLGCKNSIIPTDDFIKSISYNTFCNVGLTRIEIPSNIKEICNGSFYKSEDLEEVVLNDGLEYVGEYAFSYCYKIKSIIVPKTVKECSGFTNCKCQIIIFKDTKCKLINDFNYNYYFTEGIDDRIITFGGSAIRNNLKECEIIFDDEYYVYSISNYNTINVIVPYRKGYKFLGWSTSLNKDDIVTRIETIQVMTYALSTMGYAVPVEGEFVEVTVFDENLDYTKYERFYSIWEKEKM